MSGYDITQQAVSDMAAIHIKGADGQLLYTPDRKPVRIVVYGPSSKAHADVDARQTNRSVKRMQDNDGKVAAVTAEQRNGDRADDLADITVSFENLDYKPAGDAQGRELFRALYADPKLGFIPEQLLKAVRDWGNFKNGSGAN